MNSAWGSFRKCIPVKYLCLYRRYKNPVNDPFDWQLTGIPFVLWVRSCSQWNGPPKHASRSTASCFTHHGPIDNPELCVGYIQIRDVIMCVNIKQLAIVATGVYVPVTYMHLSLPIPTLSHFGNMWDRTPLSIKIPYCLKFLWSTKRH